MTKISYSILMFKNVHVTPLALYLDIAVKMGIVPVDPNIVEKNATNVLWEGTISHTVMVSCVGFVGFLIFFINKCYIRLIRFSIIFSNLACVFLRIPVK